MDALKLMQSYKGGFFVEPVPNIAAGTNFVPPAEPNATIAEKIKKFGFKYMHDKGYLNVTPDEKLGASVSEPVPSLSSMMFEPTKDVASKMSKYGQQAMQKKGYIFAIK